MFTLLPVTLLFVSIWLSLFASTAFEADIVLADTVIEDSESGSAQDRGAISLDCFGRNIHDRLEVDLSILESVEELRQINFRTETTKSRSFRQDSL